MKADHAVRAEAVSSVTEMPGRRPRSRVHHFKRPDERAFTRAERAQTTVLMGGLTWNHERLIQGAWQGLGYRCEVLPVPDVAAFQLGKEYGNNGQCNPTYFTVGNLVKFLQGLEDGGLSREEIQNKYVYVTAGACGPCRFGMYESEYRLALRNAGFDGFRVLIFQQSGGLDQVDVEAGLEMNLDFFLGMLNAMNMGDMLNEVGYMIRPFEANEGETDAVLHEAREYLADALARQERVGVEPKLRDALARMGLDRRAEVTAKYARQLTSGYYEDALHAVRDLFAGIEVDRLRVKPVVKITGEFWAQTTEGDGNFNMFPFLEREGAEVVVEPVGTWIMYMIHQYKQKLRDRRGLEGGRRWEPAWWRVDQKLARELSYRKRMARIGLAERLYAREYRRLQRALGGGLLHELACQYHLQRAGHPFYNSRAGGGEGHLEVAKNIFYSNKSLCHMVLSLKPFGCMPSTQSDAVQAAVIERFKDMIYLPIETSGEGEINAHSRVQMALGNARAKAREEFAAVLAATGRTVEELRAYVDAHPEMKRATYVTPKYDDLVGRAANFARHVAERMDADNVRRAA